MLAGPVAWNPARCGRIPGIEFRQTFHKRRLYLAECGPVESVLVRPDMMKTMGQFMCQGANSHVKEVLFNQHRENNAGNDVDLDGMAFQVIFSKDVGIRAALVEPEQGADNLFQIVGMKSGFSVLPCLGQGFSATMSEM